MTVVAVVSLCLILPVLADASLPVGITDAPTPTVEPPAPPPVVPEASSPILLGGLATARAAYAGLQLSSRRYQPPTLGLNARFGLHLPDYASG